MAQVLIRNLDEAVVKQLKAQAAGHNRSLQAELKAILDVQSKQTNKARARALAARIRRRIGARPQSDSGQLQAENRSR